jgi:hypothetical protein
MTLEEALNRRGEAIQGNVVVVAIDALAPTSRGPLAVFSRDSDGNLFRRYPELETEAFLLDVKWYLSLETNLDQTHLLDPNAWH